MDNKKLNGFNNGRDTLDGVGEMPHEWFSEVSASIKIDWKENRTEPVEFVTIQVPAGSFVATKNDSKKESLARFID